MTIKKSITFKLLFLLLTITAIVVPLGAARAEEGVTTKPVETRSNQTSSSAEFDMVNVEISVLDGEYFVGDLIPLTLEVTHPAGYRVIPIQLEGDWGDVEVREISTPQVIKNPDGSETTTQVIEVALWAPGEYKTPELPVAVSDTNGEVGQVMAAPLALNIASVLIEGDTNLRDIKPQAVLPLPPMWPWLVGGLLMVILLAGATIWQLRRRRSRRLAALTNAPDLRKPHEIALDELERIDGLSLPEQERFKEHYTMVSDVLRQYLEKEFHIPTLDRTTGEIRRSLKYSPLAQAHKTDLIDNLMMADLVKFAKMRPDLLQAKEYLPSGAQSCE